MKKIVIIGPVYPYKGGISHYTGLMSKTFAKKYDVQTISFKLQYPKFMFKKEQKDYSNNTFEVEGTKFLINTANPFNWISMNRRLKKLNPDIVIAQWWHPYFAPCYQWMFSGLKKKTKLFYICHNVLPHERFPMDRFLSKGTLKKAQYAIVHSKEDEKDLMELIPGMKYRRTVHPTYSAFAIRGIDRKTAREELGISEDTKMLLFFGFVRQYKGLKHLIKALPDIVAKEDNVRLFIVGDFGDDKDSYMKLIEDCKVSEYITIRDGYVPDKEVEPYFAAADLNVCPYESATQSGIVQIAYGFGMPVIVTRVGGLPEVVLDGKTGFVVEPNNPEALAGAICKFYDENLMDTFREGVLEQKERFSWDRMVETIEELANE